jgi:DDE superfamily endonuclease/Transposase
MTAPRKELTPFQRGEIVGAWKCGISEGNIAQTLKYPPSTVHKVIVTYRDFGQEIPPTRVGRPKIMTARDNRALARLLKQNRRTNITELRDNFIETTSTTVCINTLRHNLHENGFYGRAGVRKPLVNETNRKKRLAWAKTRQNWNSEWESIIWSDESRFELFKGDGRRWVWRKPHEKYDVECLIPTVKSGQVGIMVWGCFTKNGLGPLVRLEGKINALAYIDLLDNYLLPYMDTLDDENDYIFQEDNAPIHTARLAKSWKEENGIDCIPWPAQSPDLNPIEHLWDVLERKVRAHRPLPKNKEELWQILQEEWLNIDDHIYQNLVDSMPRRITAVINSNGNPTKY